MSLLVIGLVLFVGTHLLPTIRPLRDSLFERWGERRYKGSFALLSAVGLVLIVIGFGRAPREPILFGPVPIAVAAAPLAMVVAFVLFAAANMRSHLRKTLQHPMLLGLMLWSTVHLLANGDLRATVLFGTFLVYAIVDLASAVSRHAVKTFEPAIRFDAIALTAGVVLALVVMTFHRPLFGVPVVPFGV